MKLQNKYSFKKGYTLLELSISLVIISFLIATVTVGSSIAKNAENRKIISDFNTYKTAINNFKLQYNQFPGDLYNAYNYWSSACGSTNCNGNGNGIIEYSNVLNNDESIRAWQHLYLSGFISGNYSGVRASTGFNTIGTNVPSSHIIGAGWAFYNVQAYSNNNINTLIYGSSKTAFINDSPAVTNRSAFYIDNKIDDGSAITGNVLGLYSDDPSGNYGTGASGANVCVQNATANTSNIAINGYYYVNTDNGQPSCALQFMF